MKYIIKNSDLKFVQGIEIYVAGDRVIDVNVGASKVDSPAGYSYPAYRLIRNGDACSVKFYSPDNWTQFEVEIISRPLKIHKPLI